jgi:SAM-dependent methyltransferase
MINWNEHPEHKTSSCLFADTLEEHYQIMLQYFSTEDRVLDVGCGVGDLQRYLPTSIGVDEKTNLLSFDLSPFNTLYFAESIGYIKPSIVRALISSPFISKVLIKDAYLTEPFDDIHWGYDWTMLHKIAIPLLISNNFNTQIIPFERNVKRWKEILDRHGIEMNIRSNYRIHRKMKTIMIVAKRN